MVLDINLLRTDKGGDPNLVLTSERKRFKDTSRVELVLELDQKWRKFRNKLDSLKKQKNLCSKTISSKIVTKEINGSLETIPEADAISMTVENFQKLSVSTLKDMSKCFDSVIAKTNDRLLQLEKSRDENLKEIGNILHPSVVISQNEDENKVERIFGDCSSKQRYSHVDLLLMIDGADYKRGVSVSGNRGYFLKGPGVLLGQALIQFALRKLYERDFVPLYTPFFVKKSIMTEVAQLSQFDEELYKVQHFARGGAEQDEDEATYLIATSEQPIAAFHRGEWLDPNSLPLKYAGISTCFRKEVGSHGRDTTGIFRVHQFEKVEQFVICSPENDESWTHFEDMINNSENFARDLGLNYRVVSIVSGALNNAAAKKLDLEAWFPGSEAFRELVSCSNCTDYQSRSLGIRYGQTKKLNQEVKYVHMLNATMCAVTRVICCILETHQTDLGINIPECLHPYLPKDMHFIKFKNN